MNNTEKEWTEAVANVLIGKRIVYVRYMTEKECNMLGWDDKPIVLQLDDGNLLYPSRDEEGNGAGVLFTTSDKLPTIPTL